MSDSTGVHLHCSECGDELKDTYYCVNSGDFLCRNCFTKYMLQNKQYHMISDNVCHCQGPVQISICPNCGKVKYAPKKES
jgi:hypothetical protein